eukprot:7313061-Pyramimonas_sp.AAC.1
MASTWHSASIRQNSDEYAWATLVRKRPVASFPQRLATCFSWVQVLMNRPMPAAVPVSAVSLSAAQPHMH